MKYAQIHFDELLFNFSQVVLVLKKNYGRIAS
jgi:hypothetical protein